MFVLHLISDGSSSVEILALSVKALLFPEAAVTEGRVVISTLLVVGTLPGL